MLLTLPSVLLPILLVLFSCLHAALAQSLQSTAGSFVQLTDVHFDSNYRWNSSYTVGHCHRGQGDAGEYGSRAICDSPQATVTSAIAFLQSLQSNGSGIDFVVWTGDNARHNSDPQLPRPLSEILAENSAVAQALHTALPNTTFIPSIGNNDIYPHDSMPAGSNTPLLQGLASAWGPMLTPAQRQQFLLGGYYAASPRPGLIVAALNTIYWATFNKNVSDCSNTSSPGALQFTWLSSLLTTARTSSQGVYLSGHVPPGSSYYPGCQKMYLQLSQEYSDVIAGHLYGHLHSDQFTLLPPPSADTTSRGRSSRGGRDLVLRGSSSTPGRSHARHAILQPRLGSSRLTTMNTVTDACSAYGAVLVAPSVTPTFNPALRQYHYNTSAAPYRHVDYTQYYASLDSGNKDGSLSWQVEYTFTAAYNVTDMSPASYCQVYTNIKSHLRYLLQYEKYKVVSMLGKSQPIRGREHTRSTLLTSAARSRTGAKNACHMPEQQWRCRDNHFTVNVRGQEK